MFWMFLGLALSFAQAKPSAVCNDWFKREKIKVGTSCSVDCATASTDMGTFMCADQCPELCHRAPAEHPDANDGRYYYPGLTKKERELVAGHPSAAVKVFLAKEVAESSAYRRIGRDDVDDESDAFRHFMWASSMARDIGPSLAKEFLEAHESENAEDDPGTRMDRENNRKALEEFQKLQKTGNVDNLSLEDDAVRMLREHKLTVIKPKGLPTK